MFLVVKMSTIFQTIIAIDQCPRSSTTLIVAHNKVGWIGTTVLVDSIHGLGYSSGLQTIGCRVGGYGKRLAKGSSVIINNYHGHRMFSTLY